MGNLGYILDIVKIFLVLRKWWRASASGVFDSKLQYLAQGAVQMGHEPPVHRHHAYFIDQATQQFGGLGRRLGLPQRQAEIGHLAAIDRAEVGTQQRHRARNCGQFGGNHVAPGLEFGQPVDQGPRSRGSDQRSYRAVDLSR